MKVFTPNAVNAPDLLTEVAGGIKVCLSVHSRVLAGANAINSLTTQPSASETPIEGLPIVIDVEASGFGSGSYPIEIAFASAQAQIEAVLIQPAKDWTHWSIEAQALHGIDRDTLFAEGMRVADVATWLNDALGEETVYSDAWHYDFTWIHRLFSEAGTLPTFRIASIEELLSESESRQWAACKAEAAKTLGLSQHRASHDVQILQATFAAVKARTP